MVSLLVDIFYWPPTELLPSSSIFPLHLSISAAFAAFPWQFFHCYAVFFTTSLCVFISSMHSTSISTAITWQYFTKLLLLLLVGAASVCLYKANGSQCTRAWTAFVAVSGWLSAVPSRAASVLVLVVAVVFTMGFYARHWTHFVDRMSMLDIWQE